MELESQLETLNRTLTLYTHTETESSGTYPKQWIPYEGLVTSEFITRNKNSDGYWTVLKAFKLKLFCGCVHASTSGLSLGNVNFLRRSDSAYVCQRKFSDGIVQTPAFSIGDQIYCTMEGSSYSRVAVLAYNIIEL